MWIAPKLLHLISESSHTRGGNAYWVRLTGMPGSDIAILNVYAPHSSCERCMLWEELLSSLPRDCKWIGLGNWNFVERAIDKPNLKESIITEVEKRVFEELKDAFQLEDPFPASNRIRFSWDSKRQDGSRVMARLDKSYTFITPGAITTGANYRILGDCVHSDHLPVWRKLWLVPETKRKSSYVMNASYLSEEKVQENIRRIWEAKSNLAFFGKIRRCVKYYKCFCIKRAQELKRVECELRKKVEVSAAWLQRDPSCRGWQDELAYASDLMKKFEKQKVVG